MQIAGPVVDDGDVHRCAPGSGNRPITSERDGGPRRTGVKYVGSVAAGTGGGEFVARFVQSAKKRCSAISVSSPTTNPSVVHLRRARVQRQMLGASKPISRAIRKPVRNRTPAGARRIQSAIPINPYPIA